MDKQRRDNQLRIIGGRWRGHRLSFPPLKSLRPTPDRVRETLFNWLAPLIEGARCLDLFAGSGALGIEALSRGAGEVIFVECHPVAVRHLRENLQRLGIDPYRVEQADVLSWLQHRANQIQPFDIAFLDPPFGSGLLAPACAALEQGSWLMLDARIYLESELYPSHPELPVGWEVIRQKTAGQVAYRLAVKQISMKSDEIQ